MIDPTLADSLCAVIPLARSITTPESSAYCSCSLSCSCSPSLEALKHTTGRHMAACQNASESVRRPIGHRSPIGGRSTIGRRTIGAPIKAGGCPLPGLGAARMLGGSVATGDDVRLFWRVSCL
jgi:hypothetical protein